MFEKCLKLEKKAKFLREHFERMCFEVYGSHKLSRLSLEYDAMLFKINYMTKFHSEDITQEFHVDFIKKFNELTQEIISTYGSLLLHFILHGLLKDTEYTIDDIEFVSYNKADVDSSYVTLNMIILSNNKEVLDYINKRYNDDDLLIIYNGYHRYYTDSYNDGIAKAYPELFENKHVEIGTGDDGDVFVHNITFQTTESCSLNCTYCYQFNKSPMSMDFETAKVFIDKLLNDEYGYVNRYNSPAVIIEFIGGEPLLEIDLTRKIYEYFLERCYQLNHPWFTMHRISLCSNGLQYFNKNVQDFFRDYHKQISFNISIDGNKELHDSCRIQPNGEGSYDIAMAALDHYNSRYSKERNSKMTLAPNNIKYLFESVIDFINHGMTVINLNCVFEEGWNPKTARIEYYQLQQLADYLIDKGYENIYISIFREKEDDKLPKDMDGSFCGGGSASMLAIRPNGQFYPCLRYMPSSVGNNVRDLCIGTVQDGMIGRNENSDIINMFDNITRRSQTNDICYNCPIGNNCACCSALSHTVFGTPDKKTTFICIQMIAEHLANVYYWNMLSLSHPEYEIKYRIIKVPDEWALKVIDKYELSKLKRLSLIAKSQYMGIETKETE